MGTRDAKADRLLKTGAEIELEIDGKKVRAPEGRSLYDVLSAEGKIIPAMCYHYTFTPFGSCGMCLVEVEGKKAPVRSCTASIQAGMVVRTETPPLKEAQKKALIKHLSTHPLDCPVCDADGHCELQDMTFQFGIGEVPNVKQKGIPEDTRSNVLDFNMNRCIACGECINICKEVILEDHLQFLKKDGFTHVTAKGDVALACEFCGDCLAVCPVGAITNKFSKYLYKPWQLTKNTTTCPYCADGCQLIVEANPTAIVKVTSQLSWKRKWGDRTTTAKGHGGTCPKGRFGFHSVNSKERLAGAFTRDNGMLVETPWLDAIDRVATGMFAVKTQHGGGAIAGIVSARLTNEDIFLFQKLMRAGLGTNQIDGTARYGHMNTVLALRRVLGEKRIRLMNNWEQITYARATLVIGSDLTETHWLTSLRVKEALRRYKATVIVANPIKTKLAKLATTHLGYAPGAEAVLIQALIKKVFDQDLVDADARAQYPEAIEALRAAVAGLTDDQITAATGLDPAAVAEAAKALAEGERSQIIFGEMVTQQAGGYDNVLRLADLALVTGMFHKEGSGLNGLVEENNEIGLVDMGGAAELLPGGDVLTDPEARARFAKAWREELPADAGADLLTIIEKARRGEIKALYIVGENPVATLPASLRVEEALAKLELLVVQDPFLTETAKLAHVVLPASTYAEKEGSFTSQEGKVQNVRRCLEPQGEARPDWQIFVDVAWRMGLLLDYGSAHEIHSEIAKTIPGYFTTKPEGIEPNVEAYLRAGYAENVRQRYSAPRPAAAGGDFPFTLWLGPLVHHSGKYSTRAEGLMKVEHGAAVQVGPADAERLGLAAGDRVVLRSAQASVEVPVAIGDGLPAGLLFFPDHFANDPPVKDLLAVSMDPQTKVVYHRAGRVALEKVA
jgi:formate dehydrogenase alpha subunit